MFSSQTCIRTASLGARPVHRSQPTSRRRRFRWLAQLPCLPPASRSLARHRNRQLETYLVRQLCLAQRSRLRSKRSLRVWPIHSEGPDRWSWVHCRRVPRQRVRCAFRTCFCPACYGSRSRSMPRRTPSPRRLCVVRFSSASCQSSKPRKPSERVLRFFGNSRVANPLNRQGRRKRPRPLPVKLDVKNPVQRLSMSASSTNKNSAKENCVSRRRP